MANQEPGKRKSFPSSRGKAFGAVKEVFDGVYWAWGTTRFLPGTTFPRNMTIVREGDELVVIHPVMMPPDEQAKVEALGKIRHVVRLGDFHGMDDQLYVAKYGAKVWAPPGALPRDGAPVDHALTPGGATPFADGTLHAFAAARFPETVIHLKRHGGMLLTCDSVQNWEVRPDGCSWLGGLMSKAMGFRGRACIGPGWRKQAEPRDGVGFGPDFRKLLELDFRHLVSAHGAPIEGDARDQLRTVVDRTYPARSPS